MQVEDVEHFSFADGRALTGPGSLIVHVNAPLMPLAMVRLGSRLVRDKHIVGYWAWELPRVPADWRYGLSFVHEIWVPSAFTADAVREIADERPVHVVAHPVVVTRPVARPKDSATRPFTVLTIFNFASSFARKNPCAAIEAFRLAFGSDPGCRLWVKCANAMTFPTGTALLQQAIGGADNITLLERTMTPSELDRLYAEADVVLSLHRSEGFGLIIAEAMLRGLPVVATNWSGNVDFLNSETGVPIGYRLVPARDPQGTYDHPDMLWAEADITAAAEALSALRADPHLCARLGQQAAARAKTLFSAAAYASRIKELLGV